MQKLLVCLIALTSAATILCGAESPYLKVNQSTKDGKIQVAAENISGKAIVAYVVVIQHSNGQSTTVHSSVYRGSDQFGAGKTAEVENLDTRNISGELRVFVDYVRLADGTVWGDPVTEQGKEVAARLSK